MKTTLAALFIVANVTAAVACDWSEADNTCAPGTVFDPRTAECVAVPA